MAQHRQTLGERLDILEDLDEPFDKN